MSEININFTPSAIEKLEKLKANNLYLKIIVKKTDFSNYKYDLFPDKIRATDDTMEFDGITVIVDSLAKKFGQELQVDYGRRKLFKEFMIKVL